MQLEEGKSQVAFLGQDRFCMSQNLSEVVISVEIVASHKGFFNIPS